VFSTALKKDELITEIQIPLRPALAGSAEQDREADTLAMAYRHQVEFAVGHGVGVHAEPDEQDPGRARHIRTATVPAYELPRTDPPTVADVPELAGVTLDMAVLATTADDDLAGRLLPLVDAYTAWIGRQRARVGDSETRLDGFETIAAGALDECAETAERIRRGVDLLGANPLAGDNDDRFGPRFPDMSEVYSTRLRRIARDAAAAKGVAWLDCDTFVTAATDRLAKVMSTAGETLTELVGHGNLLNAVSVSDGSPRLVATVSRDKTARVWDPATGTCVRVLCAHDESVKAVAWRPGTSSVLLTGSYDFDARLWDLEADEEEQGFSTLLRSHRNGVGAVGWWRGQPLTASWDATAMLWKGGRSVAAVALAQPLDEDSEARDALA